MANERAGRIQPVDEVQLLRAAACDWRLSRGDVGVLAVILRHCDDRRRAFPGPTLISQEARLATSNVKTSLRRLEELRYIEVERPGLRKANRYRVLESPRVMDQKVAREIAATKRELGLSASPALGMRTGLDRKIPRRATRPAGDHQLGLPTGQQLGLPTGHEVALEDTSESTTPAAPTSEDEEQRLKAHARRVYLDAKRNGNTTVMAMVESTHWMHVHDLADKGKLPPLEA